MTYQEILDDTITQVPPSTLDVDRLIVRERRRRRRVRFLSVGGAAAATLVVVGLVANGIGGRPPAGEPPVGGVAASRVYTSPADQAAFDGELANRLTPVLQYRVNSQLPAGATLKGSEQGDPPLRLFSADRSHYPPQPSPYLAAADIYLNGAAGSIEAKIGLDVPSWEPTYTTDLRNLNKVSVGPGFDMVRSCAQLVLGTADPRNDPARTVTSECLERVGEHGEQIVSYRTAVADGSAWVAWVVKPDGTLIYLHESTRSVLFGKAGPPPPLAEPVLDRYELIEIALDPRLSFWP